MKKTLYLVCLSFLIGGLVGCLGNHYLNRNHEDSHGLQVRQGGYEFINPLVECEVDAGFENNNLKSFKHNIENVIEDLKNSSTVSDISVYYRDLNNGPWFGINENQNFSPQSLLKVPVMIAYFKEAETNPDILDRQIEYTKPNDEVKSYFPNEKNLDIGTYSINELINQMVIYSDNNAFDLLVNYISYDKITAIHNDLGLTVPEINTPNDFISVKTFASIFRVLYNSSYLNREMSEKALSTLSKTSFIDGIVAGVTDNIMVAHKYGIRGNINETEIQLHDCGIVYYSNNPYLLCIMSKGSDINDLKDSILAISQIIFEEISQ